MNGKKAKELRRQQTPQRVIKIEVYPDGNVQVTGLPDGFHLCMEILKAALHAVTNMFVKAAQDGRVDDNMQLVPKSKIVRPGIVVPKPSVN
jgi:hypothetical protein